MAKIYRGLAVIIPGQIGVIRQAVVGAIRSGWTAILGGICRIKRRVRVTLHLCKRRMLRKIRRVWAHARIRLLNLQGWLKERWRRLRRVLSAVLLTILSIGIGCAFNVAQPIASGAYRVLDHIREVNLACAGIAGTALALILTLSITPIQKAGEAFSQSILRLYGRDRALSLTFVLLSVTCILSLLVGTGWDLGLSPYWTLGFQFLLMGISIDALRYFHARTVHLLLPETAIRLVLTECRTVVKKIGRHTEKIARIMRVDRENPADGPAVRLQLFAKSGLAPLLKSWVGQLDEFAHKAIVRGDTQTATSILDALIEIAWLYADVRRASIVLLPDMNNLLAGGQTEVNHLLSHIYESIYGICQHASKLGNELVVTHCMNSLGGIAFATMGVVVNTHPNWRKAPLVFNSLFSLDRAVKTAIGADMQDAQLAAVGRLRSVLMATKPDVGTSEAEAKALETLFTIAIAGTAKLDSVLGHPAMEALLHASLHDIKTQTYDATAVLRTVLGYARRIVPLEVAADEAGRRMMMTFPPYSMGFEANIARHLEVVAHAVEPTEEDRPWIDPFSKLLAVSQDLREHFRDLSGINFKGTLLLHWILDTILTSCRVLFELLTEPPDGVDRFIGRVEESLSWMLETLGFFFPAGQGFQRHAEVATEGLATLGMLFAWNGYLDLALVSGDIIGRIAANCSLSTPRPYAVADHLKHIEIMARAADALGKPVMATRFRGILTTKPEGLGDEDWARHQANLATRIRQLDDELEGFFPPMLLRDDPTSVLRRILAEAQRNQDNVE